MKCLKCRSENPPSNKFCATCGTALPVLCPKCNRANSPASKYCSDCGWLLMQSVEAEQSATPEPREKAASSGERRHVTVMFSDISGYTGITERLDPEEVNELLRLVKEIATPIIATYAGTINQFVGDEV